VNETISERFAHRVIQLGEKFDYFVIATTGALCAYLSQTFKPEKISFSPNTLELISLLLLIGSVIAGLKRIETQILIYQNNFATLRLEEDAQTLSETLRTNASVEHDITGQMLSFEDRKKEHTLKLENLTSIRKKMEKDSVLATRFYNARNYMLLIGVIFSISAKIWVAYY
jgi:hypothetical protein